MPAQTPLYELMYIINPVLSEEQTKDIVQRVAKYLAENDANVVEEIEMGSQRLAYPIQKKRNGYYVNLFFEHTDGDFIAKFDRVLRINDEIMRHMILRLDSKMRRHYEATKAERAAQPEEVAAEA